jgi:3-phenylpropionate/trans-cinnamate dioxygenase ferredoxin reductase subunit
LQENDTVYAAGAPEMVAAVEFLAGIGGAACYADPFVPATRRPRLPSVIAGWVRQYLLAGSMKAAARRDDPEPTSSAAA